MRHLYEDADSGVTFEHQSDWKGDITITVPGEKNVAEPDPYVVKFPAQILRDFVAAEFGGNLRSAVEKALDVFAGAPMYLSLEESDVGSRVEYLADHPEARDHSPVEELIREWFPTLPEPAIVEMADKMREAAREEGN